MLPVALAVDAEATCVDPPAFVAALSRHADGVEQREDGARVELRVREDDQGASGSVRVTAPGRATWQRTLRGHDCAEVTDALALVVAMSFDDVAAPPPPRPIPAPTLSPSESTELPDRVEVKPPSSAHWVPGLGGTIGPLLLGSAQIAASWGGFLEVESDHEGLSPSFRLGFMHAESSATVGSEGAALAWTTAHFDACPVRGDFLRSLTIRACAAADVGLLVAMPQGLEDGHSENRLWATAAASGRLRFMPVPTMFVEGDLGVTIPLVRDELVADPSLTLYRAPVLAPLVGLAAGLRLP